MRLRPCFAGRSGYRQRWRIVALLLLHDVARAEPVPDPDPDSNASSASPEATSTLEVTAVGRRSPLQFSARAPTTASTVIEGEALKAAGTTSADVIARVPGVQVARSGSASDLATASIRGTDSKQVPVYLAGIRLNDEVSGTADLSTIPLWMIDRVEVFRGNAPAEADRLGLGGAIFFTPRSPRVTRAGAMFELGSFGERGGSVAYEVGGKNASALLALRALGADNDYLYTNDHGQRFERDESEVRRTNADFSEHDAWAIGRFRSGRGAQITSVVNAFEREQGVSGLGVIPAAHARAQTQRLLAGISARTPCSADSDTCTLELASSALVAASTIRDPFRELPSLGTALLENQGQRISERAGLTWQTTSSFEIGSSVQQSLEELQINHAADPVRRARRLSSQGSVTATWNATRRLMLDDLVAIECHGTQATTDDFGRRATGSNDQCEPSARAGALLELGDDVALLGNVGRYVRVPTLAELYGSSAAVSGNLGLSPETGTSADLGLRATRRARTPRDLALSLDTFGFARFARDMIRYQRASLDSIAPFNVGSARILGVELDVGFDWLSHLRGGVALTALDPRETTVSRRLDPTRNDLLPLTSRFVAVSQLEYYTAPNCPALRTLSLGLRHLHRSSRFEDPAGLTVLPAQDLFDFEATSTFLGGALGLRLALRNLLDSRQYDLLGLPLPGRSVHVEGEAWF